MTALALRSLRHRRTAFLATFLSVFLGAAMTGSFATLVETATGPVSDADATALVTMGAVVGGWGALIVLFSVASTVGVTVARRATETGLLRTVGATPRQVRRLVRAETLSVAVVGAVLGAVVAYPGGAALLALIRGHLVAGDVAYGGSPLSVGAAALAVVLTAALASSVAGRRASRGPARLVLAEAAGEAARMRWWRVVAALLLIGYGLGGSVVTVLVTADDPDPYAAMQTSGSASLLVGVGLAALAPVLLRWAARLLPADRVVATAPYLALGNVRRRSHLLASVLGPVIVLTAGGTGVLMLVGIDGRTITAAGAEDAALITMLNYVVTGMIALFAAIMVVNATAAMLAHRRLELARLQLVGATPGQVRSSVMAEAAIVAAVGIVLGTVASLASVLPFAYARHEGLVPDGQLWLPVAIAAGVAALTVSAARLGVRRVSQAAA